MTRILLILIFIVLCLAGIKAVYPNLFSPSDKNKHLTLYGNVDIRQVDLGFRVNGRVQEMFYEEGELVQKGSFMSYLDKQPYEDLVREAEARIESVKASLETAILLWKRRLELFETGAVSQEDVDQAISSKNVYLANLREAEAALGVAQTNLRETEIFCPSDGIILTRIREPGTVLKEADPIYTLSLLSPVWVRAYVSEPDLGRIYPNMPAEIHTDTHGGKVYHGHIGFISPVAEFTPKTVETTKLRTDLVYRLRIIADNPDQGLRQGMPVTVKLLNPKGRDES
jgi:HlyD family secretion protein